MLRLLVQTVQEAPTMAEQRDLEAVCCLLWRMHMTLPYEIAFLSG